MSRHFRIELAMVLAVLLCGICTAALAATVTYTYDAAGRLAGAEYADKKISYTYDNAGNVLSVVVAPVSHGSAFAREYVQKAYAAYYGRPADPAGQDYWATRMDAEGGSLSAIIAAFGTSDEFNRRYGGLDHTQLVTRIYQQALARDPDPAGLAYYIGELDAGRKTLQTITLDVLNGAFNPPDSTIVANKLDVAAYYTAKVAGGCSYGTELDGVNAIGGVSANAASVTAAKAAIDGRCGP